MSKNPAILLIGVGNEYRRDDGVGIFIARELKQKKIPRVTVLEKSGEGASLMEAWQGAETVFLFDAVSSGAEEGKIHRLDAHLEPVPKNFFNYSTHAFSVAEAVELARALHRLPPRLVVYGIEGKNFQEGIGISEKVRESAKRVIAEVEKQCMNSLSSPT